MSTRAAFDRLLVANRGEIALRVMRTARAMGIATVAVYSDADAGAPHVRFADEAVRIGPAAARDSYLAIPAILDAARRTGAGAIHPGYGFLSESAGFAEAVADAGLVFVGPPAHVIAQLGSKQAAKRVAQQVGVATVPGYHGDDHRDDAKLAHHAAAIGYPVLVKASAGGGGRGMRVVRAPGELADALDRARGEARAAFGDDTLLLERYLERPRHIEIQVLGDHHGHVVHLWERECSVQRRHQKIVEESPSPALDPTRRAAMGEAAVKLASAVGYVGAGTVEFIVPAGRSESGPLHSGAPDGAFYFLEVNTRLQVEHPVTELVCGIDLVREQLRIARGEPLSITAPPPQRGWAIEVRLCAEDAERDYLPTTGTLLAVDVPAGRRESGPLHLGPAAPDLVRADLGVAAGSEVAIHYDSMIGKLIAHAPSRGDAARLLRRALLDAWLPGVVTNREHLARILAHPAFLAGELDTGFLARHAGALAARPPGLDTLRVAAVAATVADVLRRRPARPLAPPGWRNVPGAGQTVTYHAGAAGDATIELSYAPDGDALVIAIGGKPTRVTAGELVGDRLAFVEHGVHRRVARVATAGATHWVQVDGVLLALVEQPRFPDVRPRAVAGALIAPMPGKVVKLLAAAGDAVAAGAALIVLEAMKMEHTVRAPSAGTLRALHVAVGDQVDGDQLLAVVGEPE